ncbi:DnaJ-domain-containing protein [Thelephora ganbajun]|uniref:DnaJ-domain-containing protein n=1 Tax=Thelephora ganbajun TaxID=370292 RepID=A0ACB6ZDU5_THEGA|nr:DnaJ-domain-containing protein [Thelephora ganbajun]
MAIENYSTSSQRAVCCRILGLEPSATREEVKSAYKHLALKWHPDRQKSQKEYAKDRFVEIHEAYQTLMDMTSTPSPMPRNASSFTSPPSTPASKPSEFYSQSAGSTSSWTSSGPPSNASTPRTSTDELPTPRARHEQEPFPG